MAQLTYPVHAAPSKLTVSDDLPPGQDRRSGMEQGQAEPAGLPEAAGAPQAIEFRHLRYFAAGADAGRFTHPAERVFLPQPTLHPQIPRLGEILGPPVL